MFTIKFSDEELQEILSKFEPQEIGKRVVKAMKSASLELAGEAADVLNRKLKKPSDGGGSTGRLARSLTGDVVKENNTPTMKVGSLSTSKGGAVPYAKVRDLGADGLKEKAIIGRPWLAIPIKDNLRQYGRGIVTPAGIMATSAKQIKDDPLQYGFRSTYAVPGRNAKTPLVVLGFPVGGGDGVPIFALRHEVKQDGYKYLTNTMKKHAIDWTTEAIHEAFEDA